MKKNLFSIGSFHKNFQIENMLVLFLLCISNKINAQSLPSCATTYSPDNVIAYIPTNQVLCWSGVTRNPDIIKYDVYLSSNASLVKANDPSVILSHNQTRPNRTLPTGKLLNDQTYYWKVNVRNSEWFTQSATKSFSTYITVTRTATVGGLWTSSDTWGGKVQIAGDNLIIPTSVFVALYDASTGLNNITIGEVLQWSGVNVTLGMYGNLSIQSCGNFLPYSLSDVGQTINMGGNFVNNGYTNLAISSTNLNKELFFIYRQNFLKQNQV